MDEAQARRRSRPTARRCERWERTARLVNLVLPVGWLPLGVDVRGGRPRHAVAPGAAGDDADRGGQPLAGVPHDGRACTRGESTNREGRPAPAVARAGGRPEAGRPAARSTPPRRCRSRSRPSRWAGFRSLLRSPEAKMMLLTPLIMVADLRLDAAAAGVTTSRSRSGRCSPSGRWPSCSSACCS